MKTKSVTFLLLPLITLCACGESKASATDNASSSLSTAESSSLISSSLENSSSSSEASTSSVASSTNASEPVTVNFFNTLKEQKAYDYSSSLHPDVLKGYFPADLVSSLTVEKTQVFQDPSNTSDTTLQLGTRSTTGTLTFVLSKSITKVIVNGSDFFNYYAVNGQGEKSFHNDTSNLTINTVTTEFTHADSVKPTNQDITFSYSAPSTSLSITNDGTQTGRVIINSITFYLA